MRFCPNCGAPAESGVRFCTRCGHTLPTDQTAQTALHQTTSDEQPPTGATSATPAGPPPEDGDDRPTAQADAASDPDRGSDPGQGGTPPGDRWRSDPERDAWPTEEAGAAAAGPWRSDPGQAPAGDWRSDPEQDAWATAQPGRRSDPGQGATPPGGGQDWRSDPAQGAQDWRYEQERGSWPPADPTARGAAVPGMGAPTPPPGAPHSNRRWWIIAAVLLVIAAGAGIAVGVASGHKGGGSPSPTAAPTPSAVTSPTPTAAPTTAPPTTAPTTAPPTTTPPNPTAGSDKAVAGTLTTFFAAINAHDPGTAYSQYSPNLQRQIAYSDFAAGNRTTTDSAVRVGTVGGGSSRATVPVTFTSHQAAGQGPADNPSETCTNWSITYGLVPVGTSWKIDGTSGVTDKAC